MVVYRRTVYTTMFHASGNRNKTENKRKLFACFLKKKNDLSNCIMWQPLAILILRHGILSYQHTNRLSWFFVNSSVLSGGKLSNEHRNVLLIREVSPTLPVPCMIKRALRSCYSLPSLSQPRIVRKRTAGSAPNNSFAMSVKPLALLRLLPSSL